MVSSLPPCFSLSLSLLFIHINARALFLSPDNCAPIRSNIVNYPLSQPLSTPEVNLLFSITLRLSSTGTSGSVHYPDASVSSLPTVFSPRRLEDRCVGTKGNEIG